MKNSKQKIILTDVAYWNNAIVHWLAIAIVFINISVVILFVFYIQPSELPLRLQYNVFFGTSLFIAGIGEQYDLLLFSARSVTKKTTMRGES